MVLYTNLTNPLLPGNTGSCVYEIEIHEHETVPLEITKGSF